jgi:hypothetical protein
MRGVVKMFKKRLYFLVFLIFLMVYIFSGCGGTAQHSSNPVTEQGTITLEVNIPSGPSAYPTVLGAKPRLTKERPTKKLGSKEIVPGTTWLDIYATNSSTGYSTYQYCEVSPGSSSYDISISLPATPGYTIDIIANDDYSTCLTCGRATDVTVTGGTSSPITITLGRLYYSYYSYPSSVIQGDSIGIDGDIYAPVTICSNDINELYYYFEDDCSNYFQVYCTSLPTIDYYWSYFYSSCIAPDVTGFGSDTYSCDTIVIGYTHPISGCYYNFVCQLSSPLQITVNEPTGNLPITVQ